MSRSAVTIISLVLLLTITNGMWAYNQFLPSAKENTHEYSCAPDEHRLEILERIAQPLESAIAAAAVPGATKQSVIAAASERNTPEINRFCVGDQSAVTVDLVGLRFNASGQLVGASTQRCIP